MSADEIIVSQDSWGGDFSWARITRTSQWLAQRVRPLQRRTPRRTRRAPAITGTAKVGSTLTASPGTWNAPDATLRLPVAGRRRRDRRRHRPTLTLTRAQQGKRISVRVTASQPRVPHDLGRVGRHRRGAARRHQQHGSARRSRATLGSTRRSRRPRHLEPRHRTRLTYQWLADGTAVAGATGPTLALDPALVGKAITVTGHREEDRLRSGAEAVGRISGGAAGHADPRAAPTLSGTAAPGGVLRVGAVGCRSRGPGCTSSGSGAAHPCAGRPGRRTDSRVLTSATACAPRSASRGPATRRSSSARRGRGGSGRSRCCTCRSSPAPTD